MNTACWNSKWHQNGEEKDFGLQGGHKERNWAAVVWREKSWWCQESEVRLGSLLGDLRKATISQTTNGYRRNLASEAVYAWWCTEFRCHCPWCWFYSGQWQTLTTGRAGNKHEKDSLFVNLFVTPSEILLKDQPRSTCSRITVPSDAMILELDSLSWLPKQY